MTQQTHFNTKLHSDVVLKTMVLVLRCLKNRKYGLGHGSLNLGILKVSTSFSHERLELQIITAPHDAMLAWYMLSSCVHLSVTRRYCTKTAKRRITQITLMDSSLQMPKISAKFQRGQPQQGHQIEVG